MKKENRGLITITDPRLVTALTNVRMSTEEIGDLSSIYYQRAKEEIRFLEK